MNQELWKYTSRRNDIVGLETLPVCVFRFSGNSFTINYDYMKIHAKHNALTSTIVIKTFINNSYNL